MPRVRVEHLRSISPVLDRFLDFEREVEASIRQEEAFRKGEYEEQKRAREKRARKKRLKKLRQMQQE